MYWMKIFCSALKKLSTVQKQQRPSPNKSIMSQNEQEQSTATIPKKFTFTPNKLTIADMKVLVMAVQGPEDSLMQQKKAGLIRQLHCE
jgi:hypothetical protein